MTGTVDLLAPLVSGMTLLAFCLINLVAFVGEISAGPDHPRSAEIGRVLTVPPHAPDLAVGRPFSPRFRLHSKWTSLCGFILAFMARGRPSVAVVAPAAAVVVMRTVPFHVAGDGHRARRDAVRVRSCARRARRAPRVAGAVLPLSLRRPCCRRARSRTDLAPGWQRRALLALRHYGPQRSPRRSTAHSDSRISMLTMHSGASLLLLRRPSGALHVACRVNAGARGTTMHLAGDRTTLSLGDGRERMPSR